MSDNEELYFTFELGDTDNINADFDLEENNSIDANFNIYAAGVLWGSISGDLTNQTDLKDALDTMSGQIDSNHGAITEIALTLQGYGDIVTHNTSEFATSAQGSLADSALQPGDNITELVNNAGYITGITSSDITTALGYTPYDSLNPDGFITGIDSTDVTTALGYTPYDASNPAGYITSASIPTNYVTTDTTQSVTGTKNFTQINNVNSNNLATYNSIQLTNDIGNTSENLRLQGNGDRPKYRSGSNVTSFLALQSDVQTYSAGTGIDITSGTVSVTSPTVIDNATGSHSIAIGDSSQSTAEGSIAVGDGSKANSTYSTVVGYNAQASNTNSVAIGKQAKATAARTVAIGSGAEANANDAYVIKGVNNTANSFQVGSYMILDTSTGLIPDARISSTFATTNYVDNAISTNTADFDGSWTTYADVPSTVAGFTNENLPEPSNNNYLVVLEDETQDGGTWRYKYVDDGNGYDKANWNVEYKINETPLTQTQWDAINSGITSADVTFIGTALQPNDNISSLNNDSGYITGITSSDVTTTLGYTPADNTLSNVSSIDANSAVKTALDDKVTKTGDTMTGILNINRTTGSNFVGMQSGQITRGTTPSSTTTLGFMELRDKNNTWVGKNQMQFSSSGEYKMELSTRNALNDNTSKLSVGWDANNIAFATAPATSTTRTNATDIVTRGYLSDFLKNNSSATQALVIGDNAVGYNLGADVVIGSDANNQLGGEANVLIGASARATNAIYSVAIGSNAYCTDNYTIQIGNGTNSTEDSVQFFNYQMLDGNGIIPDARLSTNIARTSAIPTATSDLTNDSGFITNVTTALGYTPADNTLSNVSNTSLCDGQWVYKYLQIATAVTVASDTTYTYDLSSYLPVDNYNYEVLYTISAATDATANKSVDLRVSSSILTSSLIPTTRVKAVNAVSALSSGLGIIPIGTDRKIYVTCAQNANTGGKIEMFRVGGYRRIGTNA